MSQPADGGDPSAAMSADVPRRSGANVGIRDPQVFVPHEGYTVLVTRPDGRFGLAPDEGLFDTDTRIGSWWRLRVNGREPEFVSSSRPDARHWGAVLRHLVDGGGPEGPRLPQDAIELRVLRRFGPGMEERIEIRNHSMAPSRIRLELEVGADFADIHEVRKGRRHGGRTTRAWNGARRELVFEHDATHAGFEFRRAVRIRVTAPDGEQPLRFEGARPTRPEELAGQWKTEQVGRLLAGWDLGPHDRRVVVLSWSSYVDGAWRSPAPVRGGRTARELEHDAWRARRAALDTPGGDDLVVAAFETAAEDLWDLRNFDVDGDAPDSWVPNAGVPNFTGVFGRDGLMTGMQSLLVGPEPLRGALRWCAATQGSRHDDATEEQPGRMIHEIRRGPLSDLRIIPQHGYYGAHTTSTLFPIALAECWHWTGDLDLLRRHAPAALRALDWAARDGDRDGDGFLEYDSNASDGLKNEGWKDSAEAIRYPDGRLVPNPIATVEEQAFHIAALERMAEILIALGEDGRAEEHLDRATRLRRQWHDAFWLPGERRYALALDPDKRPVATVGSNPGHALTMGVVPAALAPDVAARLLQPDLFTGWGIRTLSRDHPSYNPMAYHLGAVWPFENAFFVQGFRRYGLDAPAERLLTALLLALGHFDAVRLPELFGGHDRDDVPFPTVYPDRNVPQAWTASAISLLVQSLLGITAMAPARVVALVRPRLPAWLPELTIRNLRVGGARTTIRFHRQSDGTTAHDVVDSDGDLRVIRTDRTPGDAAPATVGLEAAWEGDGRGPTARALRLGLLGTVRGG